MEPAAVVFNNSIRTTELDTSALVWQVFLNRNNTHRSGKLRVYHPFSHRSELRVYHPFSLRSELLLGSENQLGNMASYNDVFGDDDTPSWLTATKESEDEVFCFLSVSGTGGLPLFDATVMQSSHPCCGNASFPLCKKSELQTSGWGPSQFSIFLHTWWTKWTTTCTRKLSSICCSQRSILSGSGLQHLQRELNVACARHSTLGERF